MDKVCIMSKFRKSVFIIVLLSNLFVNQKAYAQWTFTPTMRYSGGCSQGDPELRRWLTYWENEINAAMRQVFSQAGMPTKQECEILRQQILSIQSSSGSCRVYVTCTECVGKDIGMPNQNQSGNTGAFNFNGPSQGEPFFSPNPGSEIEDWIDDYNAKQRLGRNPNNAVALPTTGNGKFDDAYSVVVFDFNNGNRREIRRPDTSKPYIAKSGYETMRELGEKSGLNFSNYLTEAEWNMDLKNASIEDLAKWHKKYDQFISDLYGSDPLINTVNNFKEELKTELTNMGINAGEKIVATGLTVAAGALLGPGGALIANVASGAIVSGGAETLRQHVDGEIKWNDVRNAAAIGAVGGTSFGVDGTIGTVLDGTKNVITAVITQEGTYKNKAGAGTTVALEEVVANLISNTLE